MVSLILQQRFATATAAAATEAARAVFGVGHFAHREGAAFRYVQQSLVDDGISATRISSTGVDVRFSALAAPDLAALTVRSGQLALRQDDGDVVLREGDLAVICLGSPTDMQWDDVELDVFSFPPSSVARLLGASERQLELRCTSVTPRSATVTRLWHRLAAVLWSDVLQKQELFDSDIIREQTIEALLAVTVEAFGIFDAVEDDALQDDEVVRRADAFMRDNLARPLTMPEVAGASGTSLRGLQLAFRAAGTGTPLLHLRQLRMTAAREILRADDAPAIGEVGRRLSYTNLGRFSAHYRSAFGETPSATRRSAQVGRS